MHLQPHHLGFQWHFNAFGPSKYAVLSGINPCKKSFHLSFSLKRFSIWHLWLWVLLSAHLPPLTCKGDNSQMQKIKQRRKNALNWLVNSTVCMKGDPSNTSDVSISINSGGVQEAKHQQKPEQSGCVILCFFNKNYAQLQNWRQKKLGILSPIK